MLGRPVASNLGPDRRSAVKHGMVIPFLAFVLVIGTGCEEKQHPIARLGKGGDGSLIASASDDGTVLLWEVPSG